MIIELISIIYRARSHPQADYLRQPRCNQSPALFTDTFLVPAHGNRLFKGSLMIIALKDISSLFPTSQPVLVIQYRPPYLGMEPFFGFHSLRLSFSQAFSGTGTIRFPSQ